MKLWYELEIHCPVGMKSKVKIFSSFICIAMLLFTGNTFCFEFIRDKSSWNMWSKIIAVSVCMASTGCGLIAYDIYRKRTSDRHSWKGLFDQYIGITGVRFLGKIFRHKLDKAVKDCQRTQEDFLIAKIRECENTAYGKDHGFSEIKSVDDFRRTHPITRYQYFESYISRVASGEECVMTPECPIVLGVTSGTSGKSSMIPMTKKQSTFFFTNGIAVLFDAMVYAYPAVEQLQKTLKLFYTPRWHMSDAGIPIGPNSSSPTNSKHLLNLYSTPRPGFDIMTEPEALYVHLLFGLADKHLGIIEANFASLIYAAMVSLRSNWQQLSDDIEHGQVDPQLNINDNTRSGLNDLLRKDPRRAKYLREQFDRGFEGIVQRVWPECNLIFCVDTGSFEHYGNILKSFYCKGTPIYSPIYAATEGLIGINLWPLAERRHYLLHPKSMFFELIPIEDTSKDQPDTLLMHQVEVGKTYELLMTNQSGLYRYRFGDVVNVTGFYYECPIVEFMYRQGQFLNVRGEKISEKTFYTALKYVSAQWTEITVNDYTCVESVTLDDVTENKTSLPHYIVFMEVEEGSLSDKHAQMIDDELRKSYVYESFRKKGSIGPIKIVQVTKGAFQDMRQFMLSNTQATSNQFKVPRVLRKAEAAKFMLEHSLK